MSYRTHRQLAVSLATVVLLATVAPFLAIPVGATGAVSVVNAPPEYVAPGAPIVLSLDVTDLDELTVDPWADVPTGTTLVVDGQQAEFGTTISFSPVRTGTVDVVVTPPAGTVARDSVVVRDPADGSVFAESGPVSVHPRPLSVPAGDSIQDAVDVAANGTTIQLATGDYTENVVVPARNLTVAGAGQTLTEMEGMSDNRLFDISDGGTFSLRDLSTTHTANHTVYGFANVSLERVSFDGERAQVLAYFGSFSLADSVAQGSLSLDLNGFENAATIEGLSAGNLSVRHDDYNSRSGISVAGSPDPPTLDAADVTVANRLRYEHRGVNATFRNVSAGSVRARHLPLGTFMGAGDHPTNLALDDVTASAVTALSHEWGSLTVSNSNLTVGQVGAAIRAEYSIYGGADLVVQDTSFVGDDGAHTDSNPVDAIGIDSARLENVTVAGTYDGPYLASRGTVVRNLTVTDVEGFGLKVGGSQLAIVDGYTAERVGDVNAPPSDGVAALVLSAPFDVRNVSVDDTPVGLLTKGEDGSIRNATVSSGAFGLIVDAGSTTVVRESTVSATVGVLAQNASNATLREVTAEGLTGVSAQSGSEVRIGGSTIRAPTDGNGDPIPGTVAIDIGTDAIPLVLQSTLEAETGLQFAADSAPIYYTSSGNDLSGTMIGVDNRNSALKADVVANYWGPAGPTANRTAGWVSTDPFLTAPPDTLFDEGTTEELLETQGFAVDLAFPAGSVYAFGTPAPLDTNLTETFDSFDGVVYTYDESTQSWRIADGSETLGPMEAVVVVPTSDARAVVDFEDSTPARATTRSLSPGWNFVAPRYTADAEDALSSDTIAATDLLSVFTEPKSLYGDPGDQFVHYQFVEDTGSAGTCDFYCEEPTTAVSPRISAFGGYFVYATDSSTIPGVVPSGVDLEDFVTLIPIAEEDEP